MTPFLGLFRDVLDGGLAIAGYSIIAGLFYLVLGLFLFERFAEI